MTRINREMVQIFFSFSTKLLHEFLFFCHTTSKSLWFKCLSISNSTFLFLCRRRKLLHEFFLFAILPASFYGLNV
ncbi:hypothetical protein LINPERHAP2_LOCUS24113 [Linum perenne]